MQGCYEGGREDEDGGTSSGEGWQEPEFWRSPIEDYIGRVASEMGLEEGEFDHSIKELFVHGDRLYIGYGDWSYNTGPVEIRYFDDPEGQIETEFTTDEESIDYYRLFDETLYIPGVDATEDDLLGNIYVREGGGGWSKKRTLQYALHVLDVARFGGELFAVGGASIDMDHYYSGEDEAIIWKSMDGGDTWEPVVEHMTGYGSDNDVARYERLLVAGDSLYALGEVLTYSGNSASFENIHLVMEGGEWLEAGVLPDTYTLHTYPFNDQRGIVTGIHLSLARARYAVYYLKGGGEAGEVEFFKEGGIRIMDITPAGGGGSSIFLGVEGDEYPAESSPPFSYHIFTSDDLEDFTEVLVFSSDETFLSIALWRDTLYLGTLSGEIFRILYL